MKLQTKLLWLFIPTIILSEALLVGLSQRSVRQVLIEEVVKRTSAQAGEFTRGMESAMKHRQEVMLLPTLRVVRERLSANFVYVLDIRGNVLAHSNVAETGKHYDDAFTRRCRGSRTMLYETRSHKGLSMVEIAIPILESRPEMAEEAFLLEGSNGSSVPRIRLGTLHFGLSLKDVDTSCSRIAKQLALVLGIIGLGAFLTAAMLMRGILLPVRQIIEGTRRISHRDYEAHIDVLSGDELGDLAHSFNKMAIDLKETTVSKEELQHQAEELARARDAAQEALRIKSEFLANMSHEIRTPMNAVLGFTDLLLDSALTPEQRSQLELVKSSAESLLAIINDILDFSKLEAGRLQLQTVAFQLRPCITSSIELFKASADKKGIELSCEFSEDVPHILSGDSGRIRQILINLVGNALKFTEKGYVRVKVLPYEKSGPGTQMLHICVEDSGIGIAIDKQASIFEAFTQADGSISRRFGGTGLGLTISSQLARLMGGSIWLESRPGKGSTFHFQIKAPYLDNNFETITPANSSDSPPAPIPAGPSLKIMVAEDNVMNQKLIVSLLKKGYHKIRIVNNGLQAVEACSQEHFDLILMDVQMPVMGGYEAAARIRKMQLESGRRTPIVALTANALEIDRKNSLDAGLDGHLTKPIRGAELLRVIQDIYEHFHARGDAA